MFCELSDIRKILVVSVVLLLVLVGCGPSEVRLDVNADGTQKELTRGQVLFVTLDSNRTTGYGWQVAEIDQAVLRQVGEPEYQSPRAPGVVGAGGAETFRFEPVSAGATTVKLIYVRPWEKEVPPVKTFSVQISVR